MNSIYILKNQYDIVLGAFDSLENLHQAIEFWIKQLRGVTMAYQNVSINNFTGCRPKWKWAYIAPNIDEFKFENKGILPPREFHNMNLAFAEFEHGNYFSY